MVCLHVNNKLQLSIKLKHTFSLHDQVKTCNRSISFLRICLAYFNIKFECGFKHKKDHILQQTTAPRDTNLQALYILLCIHCVYATTAKALFLTSLNQYCRSYRISCAN